MLDQEKIHRFDIITEVRKQMPKCFTLNGRFVESSMAKEHAIQLKKIIGENKINRIILEDIILGFLYRNKLLTNNNLLEEVLDFFYD